MWIIELKKVKKHFNVTNIFVIKPEQSLVLGSAKNCDFQLELPFNISILFKYNFPKAHTTHLFNNTKRPPPISLEIQCLESILTNCYLNKQRCNSKKLDLLGSKHIFHIKNFFECQIKFITLSFSLKHLIKENQKETVKAFLKSLGSSFNEDRGIPIVPSQVQHLYFTWKQVKVVTIDWIFQLPKSLNHFDLLPMPSPTILKNMKIQFIKGDPIWPELISLCGGQVTTDSSSSCDFRIETLKDEHALLCKILNRPLNHKKNLGYVSNFGKVNLNPRHTNFKRFKLNNIPFLPNLIDVGLDNN